MSFEELKRIIFNYKELPFTVASEKLQEIVFALRKEALLELLSQIGAIPEEIKHDSKEEKLYTKVSDILLAKSLLEMNLDAKVLSQRADCADVVAQSRYHKYSLVGDAKAFRLSRTARNAKDYKVNSMAFWRGESEFAVLVCPYFQYPKNNSQIYKEALSNNVVLFSWEYLYIFIKNGIKETTSLNLSGLWSQSEIISETTTVANSKKCFLNQQNENIAKFLKISPSIFYQYFNIFRNVIIERGFTEIRYYEREIQRVMHLNRDEAISELLKSMKIDSKISSIKAYLEQIKERDFGI